MSSDSSDSLTAPPSCKTSRGNLAQRCCAYSRDVWKLYLKTVSSKDAVCSITSGSSSCEPGCPSPAQTLATPCRLLFSSPRHKVGAAGSLPTLFSLLPSFLLSFVLFHLRVQTPHVCQGGCSFQARRSPPRGRWLKQTAGLATGCEFPAH